MKKEYVEGILDDMRRITMLTGEISNVHEMSLKQWPYVLFEGVQHVSVSYDLTKQTALENGANHMSYTIYAPVVDEVQTKERSKILASWVRDMFWKEIDITVTVDGQIILHDTIEKKQEVNDGSN
jgi:hypothetical protein